MSEIKNLGLELNPNYKGERYSKQLKTEIEALETAIATLEPIEQEIRTERGQLDKTFREQIEEFFEGRGIKVVKGRTRLDDYSWFEKEKMMVFEITQTVGNRNQNIRFEIGVENYKFKVNDVNLSSFSFRTESISPEDLQLIFTFPNKVYEGLISEELFNIYAHYKTDRDMLDVKWEKATNKQTSGNIKDLVREKQRELEKNYSVKIGDYVFCWTRYGAPSKFKVVGKYGKKAKVCKVYIRTNDEGQEIEDLSGETNYDISDIMTIEMHDAYLAEEARKKAEREAEWEKLKKKG